MSNIWMTWGDVFNASLNDLWWSFIQFTPKLVLAVVLFIIGWVLGGLVAKALEQVFEALKVDRLLASIGADDLFRKAGVHLNSGGFIGALVKWFVIIVFLLPSLSLVFPVDPLTGSNAIVSFLKDQVLGSLLPNVIISALILIIASFVSEALSKTVVASARSMGLTSSNMLGAVAKYAVWVVAFIVALGQLGVAEYYMSVLFTGIIAMISIAGGLAFGLGGKETASRFLDKVSHEVANR